MSRYETFPKRKLIEVNEPHAPFIANAFPTTVADLIRALKQCDPNLPVGICTTDISLPGDNLQRTPIYLEQHDNAQVILMSAKDGEELLTYSAKALEVLQNLDWTE